MQSLQELAVGQNVLGIDANGPVSIVSLNMLGPDACDVIYTDASGNPARKLLYSDNAHDLCLAERKTSWTFDGDGARLRLVSEAWRIHYAHLFDPYLAVHNSDVQPLPHQITAVYEEMLPRLPLRFLLADDPGAGKTIMAGLLIRELMARGDLTRCLIVCPGSLEMQWKEELWRKFRLSFELLTREKLDSAVTGNYFQETRLAIARLDRLSRNEDLQNKLKATEWDLIVCDEAHKMSASRFGSSISTTRRFQLGRMLSGICRHFLLLTATPHNGKEADFQLFLSLLDPDRFDSSGFDPGRSGQIKSAADMMRRLVKEDLLKFDGTPLFPDRQAISLKYDLSHREYSLYEAVTAYVQSQFNRADKLARKRQITVGFALTVLQRRLASSPEAIYQSLARRRKRLQKRLAEERQGGAMRDDLPAADFDEDDLAASEMEELEDDLADRATAARSIAELEAEIETLCDLEAMAKELRNAGTDRKWEELSGLLQEEKRMFDESGIREKIIIFTEHRDTLRYLTDRIASLLGNPEAVVNIYGGMSADARRQAEDRFRQDKEARVLVATDAAGEGINLQRSHLMVNYDLPWNPNRLEQRFGRIHRIGQTKTCWLWNLIANNTREGRVFERLFQKLEQEKAALGGKVFDVLGKVSFANKSLRELLLEAVRHSENREEPGINATIDQAMAQVRQLIDDHALTEDFLDAVKVAALAEELERREAARLQPYFIESFFLSAFKDMGGRIARREPGRYEISLVPAIVRSDAPVLKSYERVCFDKAYMEGDIRADLLCPGHPLLNAVIARMRATGGDILRRGAILIDDSDPGLKPRMLFYVESSLTDGSGAEISRQINFVEMDERGFSGNGGPAPYLDYRPAETVDLEQLLPAVRSLAWLDADMEQRAISYAAAQLVPVQLAEVKKRRLRLLDKTEREVSQRLTAGIQYWDRQAAELAKKDGQAASQTAQGRADELAARLQNRLAELARQRHIMALPPQISGGCLVVPAGLVQRLCPKEPGLFCADAQSRMAIEQKAMTAVMALEKSLGFAPVDVSDKRRGYDIESSVPEQMREPDGHRLRFIEVKGRAKGADMVNVTHNEVRIALNSKDQFILALVEVDGDNTRISYLKNPFRNELDFANKQSSFAIADLLRTGKLVYQSE